MTILKYILYAALTILAVDFVGFIAWVLSNQTPVDGFYLGRISAEIIRIIIG